MGEKGSEITKQLEAQGLYYGPSDRQLYGRDTAELIETQKILQSQRETIQKYETEIAQLQAELESETKWAKEYFDRWQKAQKLLDKIEQLAEHALKHINK